jgi:hypothetical protein
VTARPAAITAESLATLAGIARAINSFCSAVAPRASSSSFASPKVESGLALTLLIQARVIAACFHPEFVL